MTYKGIPLSGAVLLTDGADRSGEDIAKFAMQTRERKLPIHTIGIGSEAGSPGPGTRQSGHSAALRKKTSP